jgi:hypothetical protein
MSEGSVRAIKTHLNSLSYPPAPQPVEPTHQLYRCPHTFFASYLIAANLLRYLHAEMAPNGKDVELVFYDPDDRGPDLLRRYNAGAAELVNARVLYEVRGYLLTEVKQVQAARVGNGTRQE